MQRYSRYSDSSDGSGEVGTSGRHYNHVVIEDEYDSDSPPESPNQLLSPLFEDLEVSSTHATTLPARQSSSGMPGGGSTSGALPKVTVQRRRGPSDRYRRFRERVHSAEPPATLLRLLVNEEYENRQTRKLLVTSFEHLQRAAQHAKELEAKNNTFDERLKAINAARLATMRETERKTEEIRGYQMQLANAQREVQRAEVSLRALEKERNDAQEEAAKVRAKLRKMNELWSAHAAREEGRRAGFEEGMRVGRQVGYQVGHEFGVEHGRTPAIDRIVYEEDDDDDDDDNDVDQDTDALPMHTKAGSHHRDRPESLSMATAERFEDLGTQSDDSGTSGLETPRANHTSIHPEVSPPPLPVPRPPSRPRHETPVTVRPQSIPPDNFVPSMNEAGTVHMPAPHAFNTPSPNDGMNNRPPPNYNPYPITVDETIPEPPAPAPPASRTRPRRGTYSSAGLDTDAEPESLASAGQSSSFSQYDLVTESPYTTDRRDYATRNFERQLSVIHEDRSSRGSPSVAPSLRPRDSRPISVQPDRVSLSDVPPPPPIRTPSSAGLGWPNRPAPDMSREASVETLNRPSSVAQPPPGQIYKQEAPEFRYPTPVERSRPQAEDPRYSNMNKVEQWRAASAAETSRAGSSYPYTAPHRSSKLVTPAPMSPGRAPSVLSELKDDLPSRHFRSQSDVSLQQARGPNRQSIHRPVYPSSYRSSVSSTTSSALSSSVDINIVPPSGPSSEMDNGEIQQNLGMLSPRGPYKPLPVPAPQPTPPPPVLERSDTNRSRGSKRDSRNVPNLQQQQQPEGEPWVPTEPNSPETPTEQLLTTNTNNLYGPSTVNTWQSSANAVPPPPPPMAPGGAFGGYTFPNSSTNQDSVASAAPPPPPVIGDDSRSTTRELQMKGRRMIRGDSGNGSARDRARTRSTSLTSADAVAMPVPPPVPNPTMHKRSSTGFAYAPAPAASTHASDLQRAAMRRSRTMSQGGLQQVQPPPPVVSRSPVPGIRTASPSSSSSSSSSGAGAAVSGRMSRRSVSLNNAGMTPGTRNSMLAPVIPPGGINGASGNGGPGRIASPGPLPSGEGMLRRAESTSSMGSNPAYARFNPEEYVDPAFMATDRGYTQSPRVTTR